MTDCESSVPVKRYSRTKIVATVGPTLNASSDLREAAEEGVSVFRLNFSHGNHSEYTSIIAHLRSISDETRRPIAILGDLSGPKIRLGEVPGGAVLFQKDEEIRLTSEQGVSEQRRFSVNVPEIHKLMQPGRFVLLDDGMVRLCVARIEGTDVVCTLQNNAAIKSRKGVNLPGTRLPIPALTAKDHEDLRFALDQQLDYVALSFVRCADDMRVALETMDRLGKRIPLIAKIEMADALDDLESIIHSSDGAMVARGDLGVEVPIEEVPGIQRRLIRMCNEAGKPVITATQMLNSMIEDPMPTRAEVTDIANAILQGTDAVMLSGETANGRHPLESIRIMKKVAIIAERDMPWSRDFQLIPASSSQEQTAEALCSAAVTLAHDLRVDAILCATMGGTTARRVSRFRPKCPVISISASEVVARQLALYWGVKCRASNAAASRDSGEESAAMTNAALAVALEHNLIRPGMRILLVAGLPIGKPGMTNFLRVMEI